MKRRDTARNPGRPESSRHRPWRGIALCWFGASLSVLCTPSHADLAELTQCVQGRISPAAQSFEGRFRSRSTVEQPWRNIDVRLEVASSGQGRSVRMEATAPADIAGTRYLLTTAGANQSSSRVYAWLPSTDRLIRVGEGAPVGLFDSGLSVNMLGNLLGGWPDGTLTAGPRREVDGRLMQKVYAMPGDPESIQQGHGAEAWVDPDTCLVMSLSLLSGVRPVAELHFEYGEWPDNPPDLSRPQIYPKRVLIREKRSEVESELVINQARKLESVPAGRFDPRRLSDR